jgi:hypothetical protein
VYSTGDYFFCIFISDEIAQRKVLHLISHPEVCESDIEERGKNDPTQDSQQPKSGLVFEGLRRVQEERGHDDHQRQRVIVSLKRTLELKY